MTVTRRNFIKTTAVATAGITIPTLAKASANDTINVALIGCRNMGWGDLNDLMQHPEVRCVALCDIDREILDRRGAEIDKRGMKHERYTDYRKIIDRKDIDIVVIGTPDHWHCRQLVDACQSGKDVYVEKPAANSMAECDAMVAATRRYGRVVQVGQQQRSGNHWKEMVKFIADGRLGTIGRVHIWANFNYAAMPAPVADANPPEGVDFDMWLGPAPKRSFNQQRFHGSWRMFWDYGGGLLTDWGVHLLDMGLWGMDIKTLPLKTISAGGKYYHPEGAHETFDSQTVTYQFDKFILSWEHNAGTEIGMYGKNYGVMFRGTNGILVADRESWEIYPEIDGRSKSAKIPEMTVKADHRERAVHVANFLDCVKTRNMQTACTIENGSLCARYAHLGNIAARTGHVLTYDDTRKSFNNVTADRYICPEYRMPWKFPTA